MRIKNKLTPYPILSSFSDDYVNSSFIVDYDVNMRFAEVYGKLVFHLDNAEIRKLIEQGNAEYAVHIECPSTCFRQVFCTTQSEMEFKMSMEKIAKVMEIRTFIVLKRSVDNFLSSNFHPDYAGRSFDLLPHQILAIGTAKNYDIQRDDSDMESLPSILQIVKIRNRKKGSLSINTDSDDRILIGLESEVYDLYAKLGKNAFKNTAFCVVLFPAIIVILQRMCLNKEDEDMKSRHWFQVINEILEKNRVSLDKISIENDTLLSVCQSIFAAPIERSFKELDSYNERV